MLLAGESRVNEAREDAGSHPATPHGCAVRTASAAFPQQLGRNGKRKEPRMAISRRTLLKTMAGAGALSLPAAPSAPAIAEAKPVRIGILAPRSGIAASAGINGLRP